MGLDVIGSGGVRTGMDIAKCIALGAHMAGMALPILRAYDKGGISGTRDFLHLVVEELKMVMLLTGSRDLEALSRQSLVMGQELRNWLSAMERGDG
jgi:isopentenyl-diphosphate delta-isomerase